MENSQICEKLEELLIQSESRMDRTNEMVCKCAVLMEKLTTEYITQIDKLQEARDKLIDENARLIKIVEKTESQVSTINKKYDTLLERVLNMIPSNSGSENNINIK